MHLYGSLIGPAVGVAAVILLGERQPRTLLTVADAICDGTWIQNTILNGHVTWPASGWHLFRM